MKMTDKCSFCGRSRKDVALLIGGINGYICDQCAAQANTIVKEAIAQEDQKAAKELQIKKPIEIKEFLDQYAVGQDEAKKHLAVAVYNHYKRHHNFNYIEKFLRLCIIYYIYLM